MRLVSVASADGDPLGRLGLVVEGERIVLAGALGPDLPQTMEGLLAGGLGTLNSLREAAASPLGSEESIALGEAELLAPVPTSRQIIAVGRNYREHATEQGMVPPEIPMLFAKLPSSIAAPGEDIRWDPSVATQVDYEAELGVVIGHTASKVSVDEALDYVFGYCCVNDITARDLQRSDGQWLRGKSSDTFCPFGPMLVTADAVPDPQRLHISCHVNGEVRQESNTSEMFYSVAEIIAHISRVVTLQPGDLISTGTPGGVGMHRTPPMLLADGDLVEVTVEGLGTLTNRCRTQSGAPSTASE